jgi:hypothetical protein
MKHQRPIDDSARVEDHDDDGVHEILPNLAYKRLLLVNVVFVAVPDGGDRSWVLVDAGICGQL